jgi:hypothetical protein
MREKLKNSKVDLTALDIFEEGDALVIVRPASRKTGVALLVFAFAWNIPLWLVLANLRPENTPEGYTPLSLTLCMIPFLLAGVGLMVYGLHELVNTTTYHLTSETISYTTAPLPFIGREWQVKNVRAVDVREHTSDDTVYYDVRLVMRRGFPQPLLTQLRNKQQAEEVREMVGEYLEI